MPSKPWWWYEGIDKLRNKRTGNPGGAKHPGGNGQDLRTYVEVQVVSDPKGWAGHWADAILTILNAYPTVGSVYRQLRPHFRFDGTEKGTKEYSLLILPDSTIVVPASIAADGSFLSAAEFARWFALDILGHLLFLRVSAAKRRVYETWIKDKGPMIEDGGTAETEAAYLFLLAASGPDSEIVARSQKDPTTFHERWNWVRDEMVNPYV